MRLLFLSNVFPSPLHPTKGTFNRGLVKALTQLGHDVSVVAPIAWTDWLGASRPQRRELRQTAGSWQGLAVRYPVYFYTPGVLRTAYGRFMWRGIRTAVHEVLTKLRPQAVISYWAHPDGECAVRAARLAGIPAITMVGGSDVLMLTSQASRRRAIYDILQDADAVVAVSKDLQNKIVANGIDGRKVHVVRRGIDTNRFGPGDREAARGRLGIPRDEKLLLWVGRIERVKGLSVLVEAMQRLYHENPSVRALLVGGGTRATDITSQIKTYGLEDHIKLVGPVPHGQLTDYYRAADLTVLPSLSEGVPNVLLESMACGTPFVASEVGGIPEIASADHDRLVPPGDSVALAAAIRERLTSPAPLGKRAFMPEDWPTAASRLIDVIEPLVRQAERPQSKAAAACLTTSTA